MGSSAVLVPVPGLVDPEQPGQDPEMQALLESLWEMTWGLSPAQSKALKLRLSVRRWSRVKFRPEIVVAAVIDQRCTRRGWWDPPVRPAFVRLNTNDLFES